MELPNYMVVPVFIFCGTSMMFSEVAAPVCIYTTSAQRYCFLFSPHSCWCLFFIFLIITVLTGMSFWFAFPWWLVMLSALPCMCWPFVSLLWKNVYSEPVPIFLIGFFFFFLLLSEFFYSFNINLLTYIWFVKIFSHFIGYFFIWLMVSFTVKKLFGLI